jgi:hypothetical protein
MQWQDGSAKNYYKDRNLAGSTEGKSVNYFAIAK